MHTLEGWLVGPGQAYLGHCRMLAAQLGEDRIRAQAEAFGIGGSQLAVPMTVAPSTLGDIPDTAAAK